MSTEDRRRLSQEMMDRIDAVVSGHDTQRSPEADPWYVGRVPDEPPRFDEEPEEGVVTADGVYLERGTLTTSADMSESTSAFFDGVDRARRLIDCSGFVRATDSMQYRARSFGFLTTAVRRAEAEANAAAAAREGTLRELLDRLRDALETATIDVRLALLAHLDRHNR